MQITTKKLLYQNYKISKLFYLLPLLPVLAWMSFVVAAQFIMFSWLTNKILFLAACGCLVVALVIFVYVWLKYRRKKQIQTYILLGEYTESIETVTAVAKEFRRYYVVTDYDATYMQPISKKVKIGDEILVAVVDVPKKPELCIISLKQKKVLYEIVPLDKDGAFFKKLQRYEELEEKGLLRAFPCKVGDVVWCIFAGTVYEAVAEKVVGYPCDETIRIDVVFRMPIPYDWEKKTMECRINGIFGESVFLDEWDAKITLREMANSKIEGEE